VSYAPVIEDNTRAAFDPSGTPQPPTLKSSGIKSTVGGSHSVKLTRTGWERIVAEATRMMTA
jgi:hypothetical protein